MLDSYNAVDPGPRRVYAPPGQIGQPLHDKALQDAFILIRKLQGELEEMRKDIERLRLGPPVVLYSCPCQPPFRDARPPYEVTS